MSGEYEKKILSSLLDKYEKSKAYSENSENARVFLKPAGDASLMEELENPEQKALFLETLQKLAQEGLIRYKWVRHEEGNLVDSIHLVLDADRIDESYKRTGRISKAARVQALLKEICRALRSGKLEPGGQMEGFLLDQKKRMTEKKVIPRFFFYAEEGRKSSKGLDEGTLNRNLLEVLCAMDENRRGEGGGLMERVMSARLFGDSKYFEHNLKSRVISILRSLIPDGEDLPADDELLGEYGVIRWPEIFEMTGELTAVRKDGGRIEYGSEPSGAYINSLTVGELDHVELANVRKIFFIENKANYVWYSLYQRKSDELVLFHGGCYSPSKKRWFHMILDAAAPETKIYHWSDIDIGGFRIFTRLRRELAPAARPWMMDRKTLEHYFATAMPITEKRYLSGLEKLLDDPEYEIFYDVIRYMIAHKVRLEQEQCISDPGMPLPINRLQLKEV